MAEYRAMRLADWTPDDSRINGSHRDHGAFLLSHCTSRAEIVIAREDLDGDAVAFQFGEHLGDIGQHWV